MLLIYVHHGAPFCVKRHCLPLTRLPRVAGGAPAVNHKATAIWLALRILAGNKHWNVCDGNMVSEYIFNFFMAIYEWMHPKYVCRVCNYLFCIHAKCYKHISPSYNKPDAQSLKFYWRCSYCIFSQFSIENLNDSFLIAILPNILQKEKNEIGVTHFTSKWNNNGKTVKTYFKWS